MALRSGSCAAQHASLERGAAASADCVCFNCPLVYFLLPLHFLLAALLFPCAP